MNNTKRYESLVKELNTISSADKSISAGTDDLEASIFRATENLPQEPASANAPVGSAWSLKSVFFPSVFVSAIALTGLVFLSVSMLMAPTKSVQMVVAEEADLTFQELWLSEDEMLFSSGQLSGLPMEYSTEL